jgi:hypothetical protein
MGRRRDKEWLFKLARLMQKPAPKVGDSYDSSTLSITGIQSAKANAPTEKSAGPVEFFITVFGLLSVG